jgi:hypothetical protein
MYGRKRAAGNRQNNSSDDEVTDDEELRSDPSGRRRKRLAQAACRKPAGPQRVLVSSTTARHTMAERASPASEQAVTELIAEEAVTYSHTRAAANTTIHAVREAVLLVPAATEAAPSEEESQAVPVSRVSIAAGSNAAAVDSKGRAMVNAVTDVEGAAVNIAVGHVEHETTMAMSAAKSALPIGATMTVPNSEIAEVAGPGVAASTAGSRAGSTVLRAGGSIASINGQCSSSKRKARVMVCASAANAELVVVVTMSILMHCRCGTQAARPPTQPNQLFESAVRVSSPNPKSVLIFRVKCRGQSSEPTIGVSGRTAGASRPSSPTQALSGSAV